MLGWILVALLVAVGGYDLYLVVKKRKTMSQKYHALLPQWADYIVLGVTMVLAWALFGELVFSIYMIGVIAGHLFWHEGG